MKAKPSKKQKKATSARKPAGKVKMSATASGLTSQAGLIPVVKFLERIGFEQTVNQTVPHQRGDNAEYQLTGSMLLVVVGMVGGASSIAKLCAVWSDDVLREVAGWLKIPVETTISRIFKEVTEKQISQLESVTHKLRGQIWRKANRAGVSKVGLNPVQWIDIDSTVDSVCGTQKGAAKGYNPKKKGALSYHPQLAFWAGSKEILQAWFRTGNAYTSNGVVEVVKHPDQAKARRAIAVPLSKTAVVILREQVGKHLTHVFTYHGNPVTQLNTKAWRQALERVEIKDFRWNDLRQTWASWHVQAGTPLHVLQELGGWESVEMVQRYAHLSSEYLAGYVDLLSALHVVEDESDSYDLATGNKKGLGEKHLSL